MKQIKIMVIEDDPAMQRLLSRMFKKEGFKVISVKDPKQVIPFCFQEMPHLIIMDIIMPEKDGFTLVKEIKKHSGLSHIPIVFYTVKEDIDSRFEALELGAIDFIEKTRSLSEAELRLKIKNIVAFIEENIELRRKIKVDFLTGILNREGLLEMLDIELSQLKRHNLSLSMLMLDIDNFKLYNDTYGHLAGDEVLKQIATLVKENIRKTDVFGRYGGEEFLLILPNTPINKAHLLGKRIINLIYKADIHHCHGIDKRITVSIGADKAYPEDNAFSFIERVDKALYQAKQGGKNRIVCFEES
ncbi:MAG TPA: diguanylate cyclase [Candidatus Desulfofervidus auxilii]|uniref:diguanylate cyclase n=1 Tax=Desulfofervidus auxilii TaxID=1621989 RepID=A0A7V0IA78_DESA2|nr:diguanylate cyclase [Candidatus Desulfofervidus auxilii]